MILNKEKQVYIFLELNMAHDHGHHNHDDMVTKVNVVTNHAQDIIQQQAKSDHSGHGSATNMMMSVSI